jgi:hypothetical protein
MSIFKKIMNKITNNKTEESIIFIEKSIDNSVIELEGLISTGLNILEVNKQEFIIYKKKYNDKENNENVESGLKSINNLVSIIDELWTIIEISIKTGENLTKLDFSGDFYSKNCLTNIGKISQTVKDLELFKFDLIKFKSEMVNCVEK